MISYELRLLSDLDDGRTDKPAAAIVKERLNQFQDALAKLTKLGWSMRLTPTGVEFDIPDGFGDEVSDDGVVLGDLNGLNALERAGIPLEIVDYIDHCAPTPEDIDDASQEFSDRLEYVEAHRKLADPTTSVCCQCQDELQARMQKHEQQYGARSLLVPCHSDFEHGVLHGKVEALHWIQGESMTDPVERLQDQHADQQEESKYPNDWDQSQCSCDSHYCAVEPDLAFA